MRVVLSRQNRPSSDVIPRFVPVLVVALAVAGCAQHGSLPVTVGRNGRVGLSNVRCVPTTSAVAVSGTASINGVTGSPMVSVSARIYDRAGRELDSSSVAFGSFDGKAVPFEFSVKANDQSATCGVEAIMLPPTLGGI